MRAAEPPKRMPPVRLRFYLFILAIGVALLIFAVHGKLLSGDAKAKTIIGVMTTLLIISSVELIPELFAAIDDHSEAGKFRRFFGTAALNQDVRLVFAHRCLKPEVGPDPWITHHPLPEINGAKPVPEGINAWNAFQDVRAAAYLSSLFGKFGCPTVKFIHDKDIELDDFNFCAISIGLGFNGFTHRLAGWCDNDLFEIKAGDSTKRSFTYKTDYFAIGKERIVPEPPPGKDDCIVARIVAASDRGKAKRICFVCAGRSAAGTAVAGYFLAHHWDRLLKLYQEKNKNLERDSLVVVVRHTVDPTGVLEFDSQAQIAEKDGEPICAWGLTSGIE